MSSSYTCSPLPRVPVQGTLVTPPCPAPVRGWCVSSVLTTLSTLCPTSQAWTSVGSCVSTRTAASTSPTHTTTPSRSPASVNCSPPANLSTIAPIASLRILTAELAVGLNENVQEVIANIESEMECKTLCLVSSSCTFYTYFLATDTLYHLYCFLLTGPRTALTTHQAAASPRTVRSSRP